VGLFFFVIPDEISIAAYISPRITQNGYGLDRTGLLDTGMGRA